MAKYVVNFSEAEQMAVAMATVTAKDSVTEFIFGAKETEAGLLNQAVVYADREQVTVKFMAEKPDDFTEAQRVVLDTKIFLGTFQALTALKGDVTFEVTPAVVAMSVGNKARLTLSVLSEDKVPLAIPVDNSKVVLQARVKGAELLSCIKTGASQVGDTSDANGLGNAVLAVAPTMFGVFSANQTGASTATCNVTMAEANETVAANMAAYLEKKGIEKPMFAIPSSVVASLTRLLAASETAMVALTDTHIYLIISNKVMYAGTLGAKMFENVVRMVSQWKMQEKVVATVVDAESLKASVGLVKKVMDAQGDKGAVRLTLTSDEVRVEQIKAGDSVARVGAVEGMRVEESIALNPALLIDALSNLKNGNLKLSIGAGTGVSPIMLSNGTISADAADSGFVFLAPVAVASDSDDEEDEAEPTVLEETTQTNTDEAISDDVPVSNEEVGDVLPSDVQQQ